MSATAANHRPRAQRAVSHGTALARENARAALFLAGLCALGACRRSIAPEERDEHALALPGRGALVVVEESAGEFFEARVLSSDAARLRVLRADVENALSVPLAAAYTPPARTPPAPQSFAICEQPASHWIGCRVESVAGNVVTASDADGQQFQAAPERVLTPTPFTASNIQHRFERQAQALDFERQAAQAGEPPRDPGFRPMPHTRVVAKVGADWFTAYVVEIDEDGLIVSLNERSRREKLPASAVIAEPPYPLDLHHGQFVLVRPSTQSAPWPRRMVRSFNQGELRLSDAAGTSVSASVREVIPLSAK